jgi:ribulose-phosphate 3-epimerase
MEVIPAINAQNLAEIKERLALVEPHVKWVHLDVADGTFTPNTLWYEPSELGEIKTKLKIEAHLMVADIDSKIAPWLARAEVARVIFHAEAAQDPSAVISACAVAGKEVGLSVKPDIKWEAIQPYLEKINLVQILAVSPGRAGQDFDEHALEKISAVRKSCPSCIIEVDGGMNMETVALAKKAGADIVVAASAIFGGGEIGEKIRELRGAV